MGPLGIMLLLVAVGMSGLIFWLSRRAQWHAAAGLAVAVPPIPLTFFFGVLGLVIAAFYLAAMFKVLT
jgi:hypothetical protein